MNTTIILVEHTMAATIAPSQGLTITTTIHKVMAAETISTPTNIHMTMGMVGTTTAVTTNIPI